MEANAPIGVFDSGLGGISVLCELRLALPHENFIYLADSRHCPYGGREVGLVQRYSQAMAEALLGRGVKLVTVACNTATVNAIDMLRQRYEVPFVGMEPAVKPAADVTRSGVVGVLSTRATADGARVRQLIERYAHGAKILVQACPGLVECVESGHLDDADTRTLVARYVAPLLEAGADTLVLGCTHYVFLRPLIADVVGPHVKLIDTGAAVARRALSVLSQQELLSPRSRAGTVTWLTTASAVQMNEVASRLWGAPVVAEEIS